MTVDTVRVFFAAHGIDLAARYLPAGPSAVGGDFYDACREL